MPRSPTAHLRGFSSAGRGTSLAFRADERCGLFSPRLSPLAPSLYFSKNVLNKLLQKNLDTEYTSIKN